MTLIEVMIAVALLTLVMAFAWGGYSVSIRQQQRMQDINERLHGVEQAINRIIRDLATAFITAHGTDEAQMKIRYQTKFLGTENRIDFTSMGNIRMYKDEKVGDQAEISYYTARISNDTGELVNTLIRRQQAPINDDFTKGGTILPLLENIREFNLAYWDDAKAEIAVGSDGWIKEWDTEHSEYKDRLPSRVKIEVLIDDPLGGSEPVLFSTQAEIHLTNRLNF